MDGDGIDHETKILVNINTRLLVKAFSNKLSFISSKRTIGILFDAKTYLLPTIFCHELGGKIYKVSFRMRASYLYCMA